VKRAFFLGAVACLLGGEARAVPGWISDDLHRDMIGVPNGVAGLDARGQAFAPVNTTAVVAGMRLGGSVQGSFWGAVNPQLGGDAPFNGSWITQIGGGGLALPHSPYGGQAGLPQSLVVNGAPSGPFNAGCSLCLFMEPNAGGQAAISGGDYRGGVVPGGDMVEFFANAVNPRARLILPVARYTARSVEISGGLTVQELSQIQPGMNIMTNSAIPGVPVAVGANSALGFYAGVIRGVATAGGVTTIGVYGWAQEGTQSRGAVPDMRRLEGYFWKGQDRPIVAIGTGTKTFARNVYMTYDGSKGGGTGAPATSPVHQMTGEELDMNVSNETRVNAVNLVGITVSPLSNPPGVLTSDSVDFVAGGQLPHHFSAWDGCYRDGSGNFNEAAFDSTGSWIGGACSLGQLPGVSDQEVAEFRALGGTNPWRLMYHMSLAHGGGAIENTNMVPRLGVVLGGANGSGFGTGSHQADFEWNWNGNYGGVAICGDGGNCGLVVEGNGASDFWQRGLSGGNGVVIGAQPAGRAAALGVYTRGRYGNDLVEVANGGVSALTVDRGGNMTVGGAVKDGSYSLGGLPSGPLEDGAHAWCSSCRLNGVVGVEAYWHRSDGRWHDAMNGTLRE